MILQSILWIKLNFSVFNVKEYDESCEEYSKIEKILILNYSIPKLILFVFLNIITAFLINFLIIWYPKLKLFFYYSIVEVSKGRFVGIYALGNINMDLFYLLVTITEWLH